MEIVRKIFKRPLIGWGLFATVVALICLVMYNAPMSSSKGKGNKAFEQRDDLGPELIAEPGSELARAIDLAKEITRASEGAMGTATATWNEHHDPTARTYRLYYGPASREYGEPIQTTSRQVTVAGLTAGSTYYFAVNSVRADGTESFFADNGEVSHVVGPAPVPTPAPTPVPTPTPNPTPAPTATVSPTPGINVPATVKFVWVIGTALPTPFPITVTTSNGAAWTSQDTSPWFDTSPHNQGPSGASCILKPHTHSSYPAQNLTISSPGLQSKTVKVTMTRPVPTSPTPVPSTPSPTPCVRPTPPCPCNP